MNKQYYICITPFFPSQDNWRGAYILDQVKAIRRNSDYEVVVFCCCGLKKHPEPYVIDGITVRYTPAIFMPSYFFNGLANGLNGNMFLKTLRREGIDINNIAVVHSHTAAYACFSISVKKANPNVKSLVQYHDRDPYQILYGKLASLKINALFRAWNYIREFKNLDVHICISEIVRDNLINFPKAAEYEDFAPYLERLKQVNCLNHPKEIKTIILYNGVDTSLFKPNDENIRLKNHAAKRFKIGCIANFLPLKGHMTLIKAVERIAKNERIPELYVIFIGSGKLLKECKTYIQDHKLNTYFEFMSEVKHEELPEFYHTLDLFVLPTMYEGFGCVFTEAAACGIPFMICENQGASEYIDPMETDRWLIRPNDDEQLAEMIVRQYKERATQHLIKSFDIDILIRNFLKEINSIEQL